MSGGESSKRITRAKNEIAHRRPSMDSMRVDFRKKFLEGLKKSRSKSVDRFRCIVENYDTDVEYKSLSELKKVLLADYDASVVMNSDDVRELLQEVEDELRQISLEIEADQFESETLRETEDTVERLLGNCEVCQNQSVDAICKKCKDELSVEFQ